MTDESEYEIGKRLPERAISDQANALYALRSKIWTMFGRDKSLVFDHFQIQGLTEDELLLLISLIAEFMDRHGKRPPLEIIERWCCIR